MRSDRGLVQVVGSAITCEVVEDLLDGLDTLCTFHGEGFDLPVLQEAFGIDLFSRYRSLDLSNECRRAGRNGGLKNIEVGLQIPRSLRGVNGYDAMVLWDRWQQGDRDA